MSSQVTFIAGVGFRQAGVRLAHAQRIERGGRTLTVTQLVSGPEGTHLTYEIHDPALGDTSCAVPGRGASVFDPDTVTITEGTIDHGAGFITSSGVLAGGVRRTLQARALPLSARAIELHVASGMFGEWTIPLQLEPFGTDDAGRLHELDASAVHESITIRVLGIATTADATAVRFEATSGAGVQSIVGIGGLHGMRFGPTELVLRDEQGREYAEMAKRDAREPMDRSELAVFPPLPDDARDLELVVPYVTVEEAKAPVVLRLPVTEPTPVAFGRYAIRVLSTDEAPDSPRRRNFGPALAVRLDLGDWMGDRRVLYPSGVLVDGNNWGMGYGDGINSTAPEPVKTVEVRMPDPSAPKLLTLIAPVVQVRGPWRIRFARPTT
jgi:hypothetical protein